MRCGRRLALFLGALIVVTLPRTETSAAIPDVRYNPATKHWYRLYAERASWRMAGSRATAVGGYLATVSSAAENQWIVAQGLATSSAWLGATDEQAEGKWRWVNEEPWSYSNWDSSQPDDAWGGEDYLQLRGNGRWNDFRPNGDDGKGLYYIVEWNEDPNNKPPPRPPPPPVGTTNLVVLSVSLSPPAPRPGESVEASFTVRNAGEASGPFTAALGLEGHHGDPLAHRTCAGLGEGAACSETLTGRVPDDLPPGAYHASILVSPVSTREIDPTDNLDRVARPFRVEQPPILLAPGKLSGLLGPLGRQVFLLNCFPDLRARLKVKLKKGYGLKRLEREDDGAILEEATDKEKLRHTIADEDDRLTLLVESEEDRTTQCQVSLKAKAIRLSGEIVLGTQPVSLEIPGLQGMKATLKLNGLDGAVPVLDVREFGEADALKTSGSKVKAKGLVLDGEGPWAVRISTAEGAAGQCSYRVKVKWQPRSENGER